MLLLPFYKRKAQNDVFSLCSEKGATQFIRARVDTLLDVFLKQLVHQSFSMIQNCTLEKATLQGVKSFKLQSKNFIRSLFSALFVV